MFGSARPPSKVHNNCSNSAITRVSHRSVEKGSLESDMFEDSVCINQPPLALHK